MKNRTKPHMRYDEPETLYEKTYISAHELVRARTLNEKSYKDAIATGTGN